MNEQQLRDKEALIDAVVSENATIIDRTTLDDSGKTSAALIEMIKPVLSTAHDVETIKEFVSMGISAWNCGIIKQTSGEDQLKNALKGFRAEEGSPERKLLNDYIQIKCNRYSQFTELITDYKISFTSDGKMSFTVMTLVR